jgi:twitching motility protein PilJ
LSTPKHPDPTPTLAGPATVGDDGAKPSGLQRIVGLVLVLGLLAALLLAFGSLLDRERHGQRNEEFQQVAVEAQSLARYLGDAAQAAAGGEELAFADIRERMGRLAALCRAEDGGPPLLAAGRKVPEHRLEEADSACVALLDSAGRVERARHDLLRFYELASSVRARLCRLATASERTAELFAETDAPPRMILDAAMQVARARRMSAALRALLDAGAAESGSEVSNANTDEFEVALDALRRSRIPKAPESSSLSTEAEAALEEIWPLYQTMRLEADQLFELRTKVRPAIDAGQAAGREAKHLVRSLEGIARDLRDAEHGRLLPGLGTREESALLFGGLALVFLGLLGLQQLVRSRRRARASQVQNLTNRRAIERLLEEMSGLADGDLTVEAQATSDVTGAIADTVNYVVTALRGLVTTIKDTSARVNDSAQRTRDIAAQLAEGSDKQARQIEQASDAISSMTGAIDSIARDAAESAGVANRSVDVAGRGAQAVRDTIAGMNEIRGRINETSKRIRRLGDSSQEIGEMVELIDDIADQTNILALNAAMQAAMAGEAGRGFAVVADEVQRLAERSGNATKQIDAIVRTIRRDTTEAVRSMEASMAGVDSGANVAENAGSALKEIEKVSNYIADLTRRIADSAAHESREAIKVNETVKSIHSITQENTRGTRATAEAVEALAALAQELRHSVAGFKLPPGGG